MRRRSFLRNSAFALGPAAFPWSDFHQLGFDLKLGHNNRQYKLDKNWSQADAFKYPVNDCHEMIQTQNGNLYLLTNDVTNNILIYNRHGKILGSWGHNYPGAHGLTLSNEGGEEYLYISDNARHQVIKTDLEGREILIIDFPAEAGLYKEAAEFIPTETTISSNGDIYVADGYGKDFIIRYNAKGQYLSHFGGRGTGDKYLLNAHGICVDNRTGEPKLLVTSRQQNAFKYYSLSGEYLSTIPLNGAWVCRPVIAGEYLYAAVLQTDERQGESSGFVTILDKNNKVVSNPGGSDPESLTAEGSMYQTIKAFQYPHDVCVDDEENIYVPQWNSGKVYPYKLTLVV